MFKFLIISAVIVTFSSANAMTDINKLCETIRNYRPIKPSESSKAIVEKVFDDVLEGLPVEEEEDYDDVIYIPTSKQNLQVREEEQK